MSRPTNRQAEPEVWFRIVHLGQNRPILPPYREQTVEVILGPKGAFENGNIGTLRLRAPPSRVLIAAPPSKPAKEPKTPRVVELLRKAVEWRRQIDTSEVRNQVEIARREGVTRARVTQIMGMLRLAPEIQGQILSMPDIVRRPSISERMLRPIEAITNRHDQLQKFHNL